MGNVRKKGKERAGTGEGRRGKRAGEVSFTEAYPAPGSMPRSVQRDKTEEHF